MLGQRRMVEAEQQYKDTREQREEKEEEELRRIIRRMLGEELAKDCASWLLYIAPSASCITQNLA